MNETSNLGCSPKNPKIYKIRNPALSMKKRGQITIFIIVGFLIVLLITLAFIFRQTIQTETPFELGPQDFVRSCIRDSVEESIPKILEGGGKIVPEKTILYQGKSYNYLCYQGDYYSSCYNLYPDLVGIIEEQIYLDTKDSVQGCFDLMREDFEDKHYNVDGGATEYSVKLLPGRVDIKLVKDISISKGESVQSFKKFDFEVLSPLNELAGIAREIVNDESAYCNFEYVGYMILHPEYDLTKTNYKDSKIYNVKDRKSGYNFKFAVRSCALPPGL